MAKQRTGEPKIVIGDVIRTHPKDGYWGCAIVLATQPASTESYPKCLVGITPWIFRHEVTFEEVSSKPIEFRPLDNRACFEIYTCKTLAGFQSIGRVDLAKLELPEVSFEPKPWRPLCGPLNPHLGSQAVWAWRRIHDKEQLAADLRAVEAEDRAKRVQRLASLRPAPGTRDYSPKTNLPNRRGELWVGLRVADDDDKDHEQALAIVASLTKHMEGQSLGEWLGQSSGAGQVDASFEVKNRRVAREHVVAFLIREFPGRDYWLASDYETIFDA